MKNKKMRFFLMKIINFLFWQCQNWILKPPLMKPLLIFLISLLVFTFLGVELNWYSFIVLPILSLSLCFAIFQRNRLMPNLISVHQFICLFLLSIFVLHLLVYFLSPPYLRVIFEIGIAVALFILITIIALRISTKD